MAICIESTDVGTANALQDDSNTLLCSQ